MAHTDELRRQHEAATQLMTGISGQIDAYRGPDDAYRLTLGVAQLLGLLRVHLMVEDGHLYPDLMGGLAERLEEFAMHWSTSPGIAARFGEFREETRELFAALETRILRENQQLYPLADRLAQPLLRSAA